METRAIVQNNCLLPGGGEVVGSYTFLKDMSVLSFHV